MPDYRVTYSFRSTDNGVTTKSFKGTFADSATAATKAAALLTDLQAASQAHIFKQELAEVADIAGAAPGTKTVFLRSTATVSLVGKSVNGNFTLPAPADQINPSGSEFVKDAALWTALMANFAAGEWTISDGDHVNTTLNGETAYFGSGDTNF
jgi:hypothetical protein